MVSLWGDNASSTLDGGKNPHEAHYLKLDCSKARTVLGWRPQWDIDKVLEGTVEWYKAYQSEKNMRSLSLAQIESYQAGARQEAER
jgi:CDP-glucose 4,6-dehydratase